ncbi:MAG: hypothetical protein HC849_29655 [Oscillatoriales cyanobacterium RU_3_3]|nr:hypothetical protein [Oscillatoriales cyanobacterium RU_3_3]
MVTVNCQLEGRARGAPPLPTRRAGTGAPPLPTQRADTGAPPLPTVNCQLSTVN